jgi:hypothetical protein
MTLDTPPAPRRIASAALTVVAAVTATGVGASFATTLLTAPALNRLQVQALELGLLLVPAVAALAFAAAILLTRVLPIAARGGGYLLVAAGTFIAAIAIGVLREQVGGPDLKGAWIGLYAAAGGIALAGLALAARTHGVAIGMGLATGIVLAIDIAAVPDESWPPYSLQAITCLIALIGLALAWQAPSATPDQARGAVIVTAVAALVVVGGLAARTAIIDEFGRSPSLRRAEMMTGFARYSLIALAIITVTILTWYAYRIGKASLARWTVLGFALGAPATLLAAGFFHTSRLGKPTAMAIAVLGVAAGALAARYLDGMLPWEALGALAAIAGTVIGVVGYREGPNAMVVAYLLAVGGGGFALSAGLVRTAALPSAATGLGLGLASLLLTAQALGSLTLVTAMSGPNGDPQLELPVVCTVAALIVAGLFAYGLFESRRTQPAATA